MDIYKNNFQQIFNQNLKEFWKNIHEGHLLPPLTLIGIIIVSVFHLCWICFRQVNMETEQGDKIETTSKKEFKKIKEKKARRSLQEDKKEINRIFNEKISSLSGGYTCRDCPFKHGNIWKAKTHAVNCSMLKSTKNRQEKSSFWFKELIYFHWFWDRNIVKSV